MLPSEQIIGVLIPHTIADHQLALAGVLPDPQDPTQPLLQIGNYIPPEGSHRLAAQSKALPGKTGHTP